MRCIAGHQVSMGPPGEWQYIGSVWWPWRGLFVPPGPGSLSFSVARSSHISTPGPIGCERTLADVHSDTHALLEERASRPWHVLVGRKRLCHSSRWLKTSLSRLLNSSA